MLEQLLATGCPLCGKKHQPKFHCFARRTYRKDQKNKGKEKESAVATLVPRILCEINCQIRKETGEEKQYTITILPGFLIPYSTIPVDPVHEAVESYITDPGLKQVGAAMRMKALSPISFRLFLSRVRDRLEGWIVLLLQLVHTLEGQVKEVDVGRAEPKKPQGLQDQWAWFVYLANECVRLYARLPESKVILDKFSWQYIYCLLSRHYMGLGP